MKEIVAELTHLARRSPEISQRSGVSVRVTHLQLREPALQRAQARHPPRRGARSRRGSATSAPSSPRPRGKIEMETLGDGGEDKVLDKLVQRAVLNVFNRSFTGGELDEVVARLPGRARDRGLRPMPSDGLRAPDRRGAPAARRGASKLGAQRSGRAWPPRSSSSSRACTSARSSTRTCRPGRRATGGVRRAMPLSRYSRWDGSQQPRRSRRRRAARRDVRRPARRTATSWSALRRLFQRGAQNPHGASMPGLQDLLEQLRQAAPAAARPLRPRLGARRHQEEARRAS